MCAVEEIKQKIIDTNLRFYYAGGNDVCFSLEDANFDLASFMEEYDQIFLQKTGYTFSYGSGSNAKQALMDLNKTKSLKNSKTRFETALNL